MKVLREEDVRLDLIDLGDRLRDVNEQKAEELACSIRDRGLMNRVELREAGDGRYKLNAGAHRIRAAQLLEWEKIPSIIVECNDDEARMREIDENLFRSELTPFDEANFLEERRQIWERVYGAIKRGGDRRSKVQIVPLIEGMSPKIRNSFITDTAEKFGLQKITIKRALMRKSGIAPKVWAVLKTTEAANNGSLLDKIRKLYPEEQMAIAEKIKERGCTVQHAIRAVIGQTEIDADMKNYDALVLAWKRASEEVREQFLKFVGADK